MVDPTTLDENVEEKPQTVTDEVLSFHDKATKIKAENKLNKRVKKEPTTINIPVEKPVVTKKEKPKQSRRRKYNSKEISAMKKKIEEMGFEVDVIPGDILIRHPKGTGIVLKLLPSTKSWYGVWMENAQENKWNTSHITSEEEEKSLLEYIKSFKQ